MIQCKTILLLYLLFFISVFAQSKDENMDAILMPVPAKLHMTGSKYILKDSCSVVCFLSGELQLEKVISVRKYLPDLKIRIGLAKALSISSFVCFLANHSSDFSKISTG